MINYVVSLYRCAVISLFYMEEIRKKIDRLDEQIISLLGKRMSLAKEIGRQKKESDIGITDEEREKEVMARLRSLAEENGLSGKFVEKLYGVVFKESRKLQE